MDSELNMMAQVQVIKAALREFNSVLDFELSLEIDAALSRVEALASKLGDGSAPLQIEVMERAKSTFGAALEKILETVTSGDVGGLREDVVVLDDLYGTFVTEVQQALLPLVAENDATLYDFKSYFTALANGYKQDAQMKSAVRLARESLARTAESERRAGASASVAADAAGESGRHSLSEHFADYAISELRAADRFRWATLIALSLAGSVAIFVPYASVDAAGIVRHSLQVLALGGVGTFLAAQSANHRRVGNWSKSIEVQLRSFRAFVDPIQDAAAEARLYEMLGTRILGAPPGALRSTGVDGKLVAQLVEMAGKRLP
ncbi:MULTISPECIES: hypothetical protein [Curtobacterium]|jgi:hypothetical protein|uniref:hypothetical protein n=1 Tax=Curtobacterium TaxID=2034 RepID=UPI0012DFF82A|nr:MULTISPECIES: hypothetical protein [Curtobacterium]MDQ0539952.1 hypothetical protein [Curtobacterium flaccumfaciens]UXZ56927.1 hypothetical protein MXD64_13085 [Curtobacterium sp. Arg-1]